MMPLMSILLADVPIALKFLEQQKAKMRVKRIKEFTTNAWNLIGPKLVAYDKGPSPSAEMYALIQTLANLYADLGTERDDFESKAKAVDALRKERDDLIVEKSTLLASVTELKVRLNKLYGIHAEASAKHVEARVESPQLNRLISSFNHPKERKADVAALKPPALRKMLHAALSCIDCDRRLHQLDEHKVVMERKKLEDEIESQRGRIEDTVRQVDLLKTMSEDWKKQRSLAETRIEDLQKRVDALKVESDDQVRERVTAQTQRDAARVDADMLRTLCRAQQAIVERHFAMEKP